MQQVVFEEPYKFVRPYRRTGWSSLFRRLLPWYLRRTYGVAEHEVRGVEGLQASLRAGHGVIVAINHSRLSDPLIAGLIAVEARIHMHAMASWHIFRESAFACWIVRRMGAFSVYREGADRKALNTSVDILTSGKRPLVIYPEGAISRTNDYVAPLMEGISFVARTAARRLAKSEPAGRVVVHPVALRYQFLGRLEDTLPAALARIERRLSWQPQEELPLHDRLCKVADALLTLKELEFLGQPQTGNLHDRRERLIEHLLEPLEREWTGGRGEGNVVNRVKNLRQAILPAMVERKVTRDERRRRWKQLDAALVAQQISLYRRDYLQADSPPERTLETIQGFEEDLFDKAGAHGPWKVLLEIGEPIEVSPERSRGADGDSLLVELRSRMQAMLDRQRDSPTVLDPAVVRVARALVVDSRGRPAR